MSLLTRTAASLGLLLSLCCARSAVRAAPPERLALLPLSCAGIERPQCEKLRRDLAERISQRWRVSVLSGDEVEAAVRARCEARELWWSCLEQDANLFALCESLKVPAALSVRVASLGQRQVVKLRWADVLTRTISVETVEAGPAEIEAWLTGLSLLRQRLYPPPPPAPAWFERWEVWTAVGAGAVLVTGVVLALTLAPGESDPADFHLRLP